MMILRNMFYQIFIFGLNLFNYEIEKSKIQFDEIMYIEMIFFYY